VTITRPKGFLNIPQQTKPTAESFDTRPRHLEEWLSDLPLADTGECARRIYNVLREINRLEIPKRERLTIMDAVREPLLNISQVLKRHYLNQNLPLSPKNTKIAELSIELDLEAAIGYKIIVEENWTGKLNIFNRKDTIKAIHHAMYYLSNALLTTYEIYGNPPPNVWIQIHQLYLYAEENGFADQIVKDPARQLTVLPACSIAALYKQILLLALISPYRLRQDIIERVYKLLLGWSRDCQIELPDHFNDDQGHVVVRLTSDVSPAFYTSDEHVDKVNTRIVGATTLVHKLGDYMLSDHGALDKQQRIDLPNHVLKLLTMTWGGRSKRIFSRKPTKNDVSITIGLSATHHLITELLNLNPELQNSGPCANAENTIFGIPIPTEDFAREDDPELLSKADFDNTVPVFGISSLDNYSADIWDPDYSSKSIGYDYNLKLWKGKTTSEEQHEDDSAYAAHNGSNINESAGGYCILGSIEYHADTPKVQVGELIGINDKPKNANISIGVIRRIKNTDNNIELGIQKLAPCAHAVSTSKFNISKSSQKFIRSLVLPEIKSLQQPITIVTHDIHKVGDNLIIAKQGYRFRIKLSKLLESTGVFSRFEFEVIKLLNVDKNQETQAEADDYENVWSLI
jgi:hypothetical protein